MKKYISLITISLFLILLFAPGCEVGGEVRAQDARLNTPTQKTCHYNGHDSCQKVCYHNSGR